MNSAQSYGTRSLREIIRIKFQHWFLISFFVVLGTAGTYAACKVLDPVYRSEVSLLFKRPLSKSPISTDVGERALEVFVKAQQQIIQSDLVLARTKTIAEDPLLRKRWNELRAEWSRATARGGPEVSDVHERIQEFLAGGAEKAGTVAHGVKRTLREDQKAFNEFANSVKLETPGGEQVAMTESFKLIVDRPGKKAEPESYKNAMYAADILADMYIVRYQELQQELSEPALQVMEDIIRDYDAAVEKTLAAYEQFVQDNRADVGVLEQLLRSGAEHGVQVVLTKVRANDAELAMGLASDRAMYDVLVQTLPAKAIEPEGAEEMSRQEVEAAIESVPTEFLKENVGFTEMVKELTRLEARYVKLAAQYTESSRDMQYLAEQMDQSRRQLLRAIVAHVRGLGASIKAREQQKAMNEDLVKKTSAEQNEIHGKLATYARLKNDFQVALKQMETLQQEKIDAMADRLRARQAMTIAKMDSASTPDVDRPVQPKTLLYCIVAFVVSSLAGLSLAFLADHFDHSLRSIGEVERYLGIPVLGSVKKRGRGLVVMG